VTNQGTRYEISFSVAELRERSDPILPNKKERNNMPQEMGISKEMGMSSQMGMRSEMAMSNGRSGHLYMQTNEIKNVVVHCHRSPNGTLTGY
jgi:hypothetical protein